LESAVRWPLPLLISAAMLAAFCLATGAVAQAMPDFSRFSLEQPNQGLEVVPVTITTRKGTHRYRVEVAATPGQQATGMMYRREMAADTGMLFPMNPPRDASFWMRNTYVSLDIIFIGADGRVLNVAERAEPLSDRLVSSRGPAAAVLELKAGEAKRIGLAPGDLVRWEKLKAAGERASGARHDARLKRAA
jgi:hypothetical protein